MMVLMVTVLVVSVVVLVLDEGLMMERTAIDKSEINSNRFGGGLFSFSVTVQSVFQHYWSVLCGPENLIKPRREQHSI